MQSAVRSFGQARLGQMDLIELGFLEWLRRNNIDTRKMMIRWQRCVFQVSLQGCQLPWENFLCHCPASRVIGLSCHREYPESRLLIRHRCTDRGRQLALARTSRALARQRLESIGDASEILYYF